MTKRTKIRMGLTVGIILSGFVGGISVFHPIFLKWLVGEANFVGMPDNRSKVYVDGKENNSIKLFVIDRIVDGHPSKYLLLDFDNSQDKDVRSIICVHRGANYIGEPSGSSATMDFDYINGRLFQSETGRLFVPYGSQKWERPFNPQLQQVGNRITFKIPPERTRIFQCDSVSILL